MALDQGSHIPGKVLEFDLGPGKLLEFEKSAICSGIVKEFCKIFLICCFCFVIICPMSTAMVMEGRSVHLTTLFPGQA